MLDANKLKPGDQVPLNEVPKGVVVMLSAMTEVYVGVSRGDGGLSVDAPPGRNGVLTFSGAPSYINGVSACRIGQKNPGLVVANRLSLNLDDMKERSDGGCRDWAVGGVVTVIVVEVPRVDISALEAGSSDHDAYQIAAMKQQNPEQLAAMSAEYSRQVREKLAARAVFGAGMPQPQEPTVRPPAVHWDSLDE